MRVLALLFVAAAVLVGVEFAKGAAHIYIEPAGLREHEAQLRQATCTYECVYTARNPQ